jgi:hypothetical protein
MKMATIINRPKDQDAKNLLAIKTIRDSGEYFVTKKDVLCSFDPYNEIFDDHLNALEIIITDTQKEYDH